MLRNILLVDTSAALLVNVDNETLARLMANTEAMAALMRIEGFRSLNSEIETIINKSEAVKKARKEGTGDLTPKEKKELSDEEKEYKSIRKQIQEKLIKFATRIPLFMYLTDYRERSLKDVITQLEPGLFKKVTGLDVKDFELLVSLNVFNGSLMNDAIFKFKRYEDSSLSYTGIDKHQGEDIGGWDTVIKRNEYESLFYNQQKTMEASEASAYGLPEVPVMLIPEDDDELEEEPIQVKNGKMQPSAAVTYPQHPKPKKPAPVVAPMPDFVTATFGIKSPVAPEYVEKDITPKVDTSNVAIGVTVQHNIFGYGQVIKLGAGFITIAFNQGEKKFMFPGAFENGFLKA